MNGTWKTLVFLLLLGALPACGELTSGGFGETEVYATADDDPESDALARSSAPRLQGAAPPAPGANSAAVLALEGSLETRLQVFLRTDASASWVEITDGPVDLTLDLDGEPDESAGENQVSAGSYSHVRVVFHRVEALVTGGLVVEGVPITGEVGVELGSGGTLTVERDVDVEVVADGSLELLVDLNASVWLPAASLVTRTVAGAVFQGAVHVRER